VAPRGPKPVLAWTDDPEFVTCLRRELEPRGPLRQVRSFEDALRTAWEHHDRTTMLVVDPNTPGVYPSALHAMRRLFPLGIELLIGERTE
jgi:hypothetical protein